MIELEEALSILQKATPIKTTTIQKDIIGANGMVIAEDIIAPYLFLKTIALLVKIFKKVAVLFLKEHF